MPIDEKCDANCDHLAAIVLCGGRSTRMGQDKANLSFGAETLLQRVCRLTALVADPVVAVAAPEQPLPELATDVLIARDQFPDEGPLGGFLTGLQCLRQQRPQQWPDMLIWASTCDAPFVNTSVIQYLSTQLSQASECSAITVVHEGHHNPFAAVYRSRILTTVETLFTTGTRKAQTLLQPSNMLTIDSSELLRFDPELLFLKNVNNQQQLTEAKTHL